MGGKGSGGKGRKFSQGNKASFRHGHTSPKHSPTYMSWSSMKSRCLSPTYKRYNEYGGRGITICTRWLKFENFLADMGERPEEKTLDRFPNNDGNYEPGNCRWATPKEQTQNRRNNGTNPKISRN